MESLEKHSYQEEPSKTELKSRIEVVEESIEAKERQKETVNEAAKKSLDIQIQKLKEQLRDLEVQRGKLEP